MCTQRSPDNINGEIGIAVYKRSPNNINVEIGIVVYTKVPR